MIFNIDKITEFQADVYRNITGAYADFDEFDDLSTDSETKKYAHQLTKVPIHIDDQYQAIDYIFNQTNWIPSRYGTGQYPVWYASMDLVTSFYETLYHWKKIYLDHPDFKHVPQTVKTIRSVYLVECHAALIDLRHKINAHPELIQGDTKYYEITQQWGKRMHKEGYPGLITYSARKPDGENIVIFRNSILSNAKHYQDFLYVYDAVSNNQMVKSIHENEIVLIRAE